MLRRILTHASAASLMAAGASTIFASPANAQVACLVTGTALFTPGYTCTAGDKLYSEFTIISDPTNALKPTGVTITNNDLVHSISFAGLFTTNVTAYSFSYKIDIIGPNLLTHDLDTIKTGTTTSITGTNTWTKTLSAVPVTNPSSVIGTQASPGGDSGTASFPAGTKSAVFTSTLLVTAGSVTNFTDSVTQDILDKTPGPLPILGAGVAFGFSRKLRRRIGVTV